LTLTLIQPASNWTHWATLQHHACLSRAATSASSQANPIFCRSLLTTPLEFTLGRPGPLLYPGTCQYSACCGMCWWSIRKTCPSQRSRLSLSIDKHPLISSFVYLVKIVNKGHMNTGGTAVIHTFILVLSSCSNVCPLTHCVVNSSTYRCKLIRCSHSAT